MDVLAAAHLHLAQGDGVIGGGLRDAGHAARDARAAAQVVVGPGEHLIRVVARVPWAARQELRLLGGIELPELRQDAAEPDLPRGGVDQAEGNKPADAMPVLGFDHKMGRGSPSNRSWPGHGLLPGTPVGWALPASDQRERRPPGQVSPVKWRPPTPFMPRRRLCRLGVRWPAFAVVNGPGAADLLGIITGGGLTLLLVGSLIPKEEAAMRGRQYVRVRGPLAPYAASPGRAGEPGLYAGVGGAQAGPVPPDQPVAGRRTAGAG